VPYGAPVVGVRSAAVPVDLSKLGYPLNEWGALAEGAKTLFSWPDWQSRRVYRESKKSAQVAGRLPFQSRETERYQLHVLLADTSGASIEGAALRIMVWRHRPMQDMTATLEATHQMKPVCLARLDVAPSGVHINRFWRRFKCPPTIEGSHFHPFEQNALVGRSAFDPSENLPVAVPVDPEPQSFRDFVKVIGSVFNISETEKLPTPPAQESML
jgi:hypothetical protein